MRENLNGKKFKNLNNSSLGIELVNKGHKFGYQNYSKKQIKNLILICKKLKKNLFNKKRKFFRPLRYCPITKIDPGEKFPWKLLSNYDLGKWYKDNKKKFKCKQQHLRYTFFKNLKKLGYRYFNINKKTKMKKKIIRAFQQHYLNGKITGK